MLSNCRKIILVVALQMAVPLMLTLPFLIAYPFLTNGPLQESLRGLHHLSPLCDALLTVTLLPSYKKGLQSWFSCILKRQKHRTLAKDRKHSLPVEFMKEDNKTSQTVEGQRPTSFTIS